MDVHHARTRHIVIDHINPNNSDQRAFLQQIFRPKIEYIWIKCYTHIKHLQLDGLQAQHASDQGASRWIRKVEPFTMERYENGVAFHPLAGLLLFP